MTKILVTAICVAAFMVPWPAHAQRLPDGTWQMQDYGRNHGVVSGPGMPKCNPQVSDECRRLYPSLMNKGPGPARNQASRVVPSSRIADPTARNCVYAKVKQAERQRHPGFTALVEAASRGDFLAGRRVDPTITR